MHAQRAFKANDDHAEIAQLKLELRAFNSRIAELEELETDSPMIEALRRSAAIVARQIDEIQCALATDQLADLLAR